jgi:hypothetical protein
VTKHGLQGAARVLRALAAITPLSGINPFAWVLRPQAAPHLSR